MREDLNLFVKDGSGYKYTGEYYRFSIMGADLRKRKLALFACEAVSFIAFIVMGLINSEESKTFYILIPYVIALLPIGLGISSAFILLTSDENMTRSQYKRGARRLYICSVCALALSLISVIGAIVRLIIVGYASIIFICAGALLIIASCLAVWLYRLDKPVCTAKRK